jgi:N-acetylmuramoyl-L-alanine amidase
MPETSLIKRLATIYALEHIRHPQLKAVTLAQWLLESGRGTSDLAKLHYNFGGLKWRPEMGLFATKIRYQAHDGAEDYCKFASLESFISGYWAFIGRPPYSGWEQHVATGEDYIRYIGKTYTPKPSYPDDVLGLVAEAKALLFDGAASNGSVASSGKKDIGTIILDPGHGGNTNVAGSSANNATSVSGVKEKKLTLDFCLILRDELLRQAKAANEKITVVLTRESDKNLTGSERAGFAFKHMAKALICLHFNGFKDPTTRGVETYFRAAENGNLNLAADKAFAGNVHAALVAGLKAIDPQSPDRGLKPDTQTGPGALGLLNDSLLGNDRRVNKCVSAYIELEFITNPKVDKLLISGPKAIPNRTSVMAKLATAVREHMKTLP